MVQFCKTLYAEFQHQLRTLTEQGDPIIQMADKAIGVCNLYLRKLKDYISSFEFEDKEQEVAFFKETKPMFLMELIYYKRLFEIEAKTPIGAKQLLIEYYISQINELNIFFDRNEFLLLYYHTEKTYLDQSLFIRQPEEIPFLPEYNLECDDKFANIYSYKLSKIQALENLTVYLQGRIASLEKGENTHGEIESKIKKARWEGNKASFYEVILSLHEARLISGDIKTAMEYFGFFLDIKPGNYYAYQQAMRLRKKNMTPTLDLMKSSLLHQWEETDLHPKGRK
ncbi:RteC domain-containing protein [Chitinophaga sp. RCC_12]|uniref:RteC domain-containing protein n=1 Tax=Chitinophaga sp. RCC_12 TaxID=3239226 RepID=UPI00352581D3